MTARTNRHVPGLIDRRNPQPASKEKLIRDVISVYDNGYNVI